jgi:hypothetical protein
MNWSGIIVNVGQCSDRSYERKGYKAERVTYAFNLMRPLTKLVVLIKPKSDISLLLLSPPTTRY